MKSFTYIHILLIATATLLGGVFLGYVFGYDIGWERAISVPSQVEPSNPPITTSPPPSPSKPNNGTGSALCARAGCSGQLCAEASEAGGIVTTCEFRPEYACYRTARCERQTTGSCGWTPTTELAACLANPPSE